MVHTRCLRLLVTCGLFRIVSAESTEYRPCAPDLHRRSIYVKAFVGKDFDEIVAAAANVMEVHVEDFAPRPEVADYIEYAAAIPCNLRGASE